MNISFVPEAFLANNRRIVSVSIIDSGFSFIPSYAKLYGSNPNPSYPHGNRILSIFTALDEKYPLDHLKLNLACFNPSDKYKGLIAALEQLPKSDILSLSLSWKDDNETIKRLLQEKADIVLVPYPNKAKDAMYPSSYEFTRKCMNANSGDVDYAICPNIDWKGNSYAVPAMARLLCYGEMTTFDNGILVDQLFLSCRNGKKSIVIEKNVDEILICPYCRRTLRDPRTKAFLKKIPKICPYCGRNI